MGQGVFQQQQNGLYAINLSSPGGLLTIEQLTKLAKISADLGVWRIKCGTRQTLLALLEEDKIDDFIAATKAINLRVSPFGNSIRSVKTCSGGEGLCPRMLGNALDLGVNLNDKYMGQPTPMDFKISTAGCARGCTEPYCADFGAIAIGKDRFNIAIGGRGSTTRPIHGQIIAKDVASDKVAAVLDFVLEKYRALAMPRERLCQTIQRVGNDHFMPPTELYQTSGDGIDEDFASFLLNDD